MISLLSQFVSAHTDSRNVRVKPDHDLKTVSNFYAVGYLCDLLITSLLRQHSVWCYQNASGLATALRYRHRSEYTLSVKLVKSFERTLAIDC